MPEPVLISIATAVASKASLDLYKLVKRRFERQDEDRAVLDAAASGPARPDQVEALAERIGAAEQMDAEFSRALRAEWNRFSGGDGGVVNQVSGTVHGNVVQARDIQGDINLNR